MNRRIMDTTNRVYPRAFVFTKDSQPPQIRMVGRYLADALEFRYEDRCGDGRIAKWYSELMLTTGNALQSKGIEGLEF